MDLFEMESHSHPTHTPDKTDRNIKTIVKNFRCDLCPAAFTTKNNLHVHQRDHTGEKPFMCHKCGKQFKRPMNLSIHMSTHNDRKQFGCVFCGKHFKHYTVLYKHVASYHELFRCDSCDKKFITEENLANHQSKHTGKNHSIALSVAKNSRGRISLNVICRDTNSLRSLLKKMAMI